MTTKPDAPQPVEGEPDQSVAEQQIREILKVIKSFDVRSGLDDETVDKAVDNLKALLLDAQKSALDHMHYSIMEHKLPLGTERDVAFNYARIHRWIDAEIAATQTAADTNERINTGLDRLYGQTADANDTQADHSQDSNWAEQSQTAAGEKEEK